MSSSSYDDSSLLLSSAPSAPSAPYRLYVDRFRSSERTITSSSSSNGRKKQTRHQKQRRENMDRIKVTMATNFINEYISNVQPSGDFLKSPNNQSPFLSTL
jgi:hypothetical protein